MCIKGYVGVYTGIATAKKMLTQGTASVNIGLGLTNGVRAAWGPFISTFL